MTQLKQAISMAIVVAMDQQNAIGKANALPWKLPADLRWFKEITSGKSVIMGRKTFASIGKALPGRNNIVITRQANFYAPRTIIAKSLPAAITIAETFAATHQQQEICIIGGGQIYAETLPLADTLYLTRVATKITAPDTYFPTLDETKWKKTFIRTLTEGKPNGLDATVEKWQRY